MLSLLQLLEQLCLFLQMLLELLLQVLTLLEVQLLGQTFQGVHAGSDPQLQAAASVVAAAADHDLQFSATTATKMAHAHTPKTTFFMTYVN
jgi:hypothetical protein